VKTLKGEDGFIRMAVKIVKEEPQILVREPTSPRDLLAVIRGSRPSLRAACVARALCLDRASSGKRVLQANG